MLRTSLLLITPSLSGSDFLAKLFPYLHQGIALRGEVLAVLAKGAIKLAPPSWILQRSLCCVEDLRVVEARDRSFSFE